jgi:hypothetical protein
MAIFAQLREIESACDPAFGTMSRTLWTNQNQVSGQSAYTGELVTWADQVIELVKPLVEQKKYLRNLFDKTCRYAFVSRTRRLQKFFDSCRHFQLDTCQIYQFPCEESTAKGDWRRAGKKLIIIHTCHHLNGFRFT